MPTRIVDVDIEAILKLWIWADPDLVVHFGGPSPMRVAAELDPTKLALRPAARFTRISSTEPVPEHLTAPVIELNVWGDTKPAAYDAAAALRGRCHAGAIVGVWADLGVVTGYETAQGLRPLQDPDAPALHRYTFATRYFVHPLPQ